MYNFLLLSALIWGFISLVLLGLWFYEYIFEDYAINYSFKEDKKELFCMMLWPIFTIYGIFYILPREIWQATRWYKLKKKKKGEIL